MSNFKGKANTTGKIYFNGQPFGDYIGEIEIERRLKAKPMTFTDEEVRGLAANIANDITPQELEEARKRGKDFLEGRSCFDDEGDWE